MFSTSDLRLSRKLAQCSALIYFFCAAASASDMQDGSAKGMLSIGHQAADSRLFGDTQGLNLRLDLGLAALDEDCIEEEAAHDFPLLSSLSPSVASSMPQVALARTTSDVVSKPAERQAPALQVAATETAASTAATASTAPSVSVAAKMDQVQVATAPINVQSGIHPIMTQTWEITVADKTLNTALARWASSAGWQLLWELPVDYAVEANTTISGSLVDAIGMVVTSMGTAEIPMKAVFYDGNKVLRIVAKGAE